MYATEQDIVELYGQDLLLRVADHNKDNVPDPQVVEMALQSADDLCNAYLSALYDVPVDPVPGIVKKCAIDIAVYNMAHGRVQRTEEMRVRFEDATKLLEKIAAGKVGVGIPTNNGGGSGSGSGGGGVPGGGATRKGRVIEVGRG